MKIVMVAPDCYMIDRRILLEARSLANAGHSVTVLSGFECPDNDSYDADGIRIMRFRYDWDDERLKRIRRLLPNNDRLRMFVNRAFMYVARRLMEVSPFDEFMIERALEIDADVYHVHDLPCLKAGYYAARTRGVPLVYDAHEIYYAQSVLPPSVQRRYFKMEKKYIRLPDVVITVNPFIARLMAERYGIDEPAVIMNCAERPKGSESPGRDLLRDKGGIPSDYRIVLFQGWLSAERNIETLVRAARWFPERTCLAIIGYGDYEESLRDIALREGVGERVFFLGRIPSEEIVLYTLSADIGVIPYRAIDDNHRYCSPNKFFEYVVAGVPVVAPDLPFFRMMRDQHGVALLTDMDSPEQVGKDIADLLEDPGRLADMRERCNKAADKLNWEVEGEKLVKIYESIMG